jgi:hypothetical protein
MLKLTDWKPEEWRCPFCNCSKILFTWQAGAGEDVNLFTELFPGLGHLADGETVARARIEKGQGDKKIRWLFVCGKAEDRSILYEMAEAKVVDRVIEARRGRLATGQKVRTLTGPSVPDHGDVEGFVRPLQINQGIGLLAYRTEFCVQDGISFLIVEMF